LMVVATEMSSSGCFFILLIFPSPLDMAPASPFIASKGRAQVTFCGKRGENRKMKEKGQKGGLGRGRPPPYLVGTVFL
jgi:hypothetical protein